MTNDKKREWLINKLKRIVLDLEAGHVGWLFLYDFFQVKALEKYLRWNKEE